MFCKVGAPIEAVVQRCSVKKGVLKNFTKFTGKHLCRASGLQLYFKKRLWHRCFPANFVKFLRTLFLQNTSGRLLLVSFSLWNDPSQECKIQLYSSFNVEDCKLNACCMFRNKFAVKNFHLCIFIYHSWAWGSNEKKAKDKSHSVISRLVLEDLNWSSVNLLLNGNSE